MVLVNLVKLLEGLLQKFSKSNQIDDMSMPLDVAGHDRNTMEAIKQQLPKYH